MFTHFVVDLRGNVLASANGWELAYRAAEFFRAGGIVCRVSTHEGFRLAA